MTGARAAAALDAGGSSITFTLVQVLNTTSREVLPVPIDSTLPAFELPLGRDFDDTIPMVVACADTGASATCGNPNFWEAVGICSPRVIGKIVVASEQGYLPITVETLSLIVVAEEELWREWPCRGLWYAAQV